MNKFIPNAHGTDKYFRSYGGITSPDRLATSIYSGRKHTRMSINQYVLQKFRYEV